MSEQSPDDTAGEERDSEQAQGSRAAYDPEQDTDADPEMLTTKHPAERGENERDPAEGPDDESATDG